MFETTSGNLRNVPSSFVSGADIGSSASSILLPRKHERTYATVDIGLNGSEPILLSASTAQRSSPVLQNGSYASSVFPAICCTMSAANGWKVAGDLQAFYGEGGYPQAVLVAKRSVLEKHPEKAGTLLEKLATARTYLAQTEGTRVYTAITSHFEDKGATPAFLANTLTKEMIDRCGIDIRRIGLREDVERYFNGLALAGISINSPVAEFYYGA